MGELEEQNLGGRPPAYETVEQLQTVIDDYFENGIRVKKVIVGKAPNTKVVEIPVPTISGLAYHLGFESRQSFYDYEKKAKFTYAIKRCRLFIEVEYEGQLQQGNTVGAIFALKNMGWKDRTEVAQTSVNMTPLTDEERADANRRMEEDY